MSYEPGNNEQVAQPVVVTNSSELVDSVIPLERPSKAFSARRQPVDQNLQTNLYIEKDIEEFDQI